MSKKRYRIMINGVAYPDHAQELRQRASTPPRPLLVFAITASLLTALAEIILWQQIALALTAAIGGPIYVHAGWRLLEPRIIPRSRRRT